MYFRLGLVPGHTVFCRSYIATKKFNGGGTI
jgi:hypothetical protein